ncbi:MAG TPA: hypothetical protein VMH50_02605 [Thermoleophilia bacterium]|nr:hypothetical protein [Thermoleophilia bacterium]
MDTPENTQTMVRCAACGAETTTPQTWSRCHHTLLCPECLAAIGALCDELVRRLTLAEEEWDRLWSGAEILL